MSAAALEEEKRRLRASLRPVLAALPPERARRAGVEIAVHLARWPSWRTRDEVVLFASARGEVETTPILEAALAAGMRVLLPRMAPGSTLEFVPIEGFEGLRSGRYGVREPSAALSARELSDDALVLVPGVAFDRRGGRIGRGGGYYDRALGAVSSGRRPVYVGVAFALQIVERVPMVRHDVFMDAIVTEAGLVEVRRDERGASGERMGRQETADR